MKNKNCRAFSLVSTCEKSVPRTFSSKRGFSLVELIIVVTIIGILSGVAYLGIQSSQTKTNNNKVLDDLVAIANAMEQYKRDYGRYPEVRTGTGENVNDAQNVLCFAADASYAHDCAGGETAFVQGFVDNDLLGRQYLPEVPLDPHTGTRYAYGMTADGEFYQIAGLWKNGSVWESRTVDNLFKGFPLPGIVRAYDSQNFVTQRSSEHLPYSPVPGVLSAFARNVVGTVSADNYPDPVASGTELTNSKTVSTGADGMSRLDIYFGDGSVTSVEPGSTLELSNLQASRDGGTTAVKLKLLAGKIWNKVVRLSRASEFSVETTEAVAGVRGTEFGVIAGEEKFVVRSGKVEVEDLESAADPANTGTEIEGDPANWNSGAFNPTDDSVTIAANDGRSEFENRNYRVIVLHNNMVPRITGVSSATGAGTRLTVENLFTTLGKFPVEGWRVDSSKPLRLFMRYQAADGTAASRTHTIAVTDTLDYAIPFDTDTSPDDFSQVQARFEQLDFAGTEPEAASDWSLPPLDLRPGVNLDAAAIGAGGKAPGIAIAGDRTLLLPEAGAPAEFFVPVTLQNLTLTPGENLSYTIAVSSGPCVSSSGSLTGGAPLTIRLAPASATPPEDGDTCMADIAFRDAGNEPVSDLTGITFLFLRPGQETPDARATGKAPEVKDMTSTLAGAAGSRTLALSFRAEMNGHGLVGWNVLAEDGSELTLVRYEDVTVPVNVNVEGHITDGEENRVQVKLLYVPAGEVPEGVDMALAVQEMRSFLLGGGTAGATDAPYEVRELITPHLFFIGRAAVLKFGFEAGDGAGGWTSVGAGTTLPERVSDSPLPLRVMMDRVEGGILEHREVTLGECAELEVEDGSGNDAALDFTDLRVTDLAPLVNTFAGTVQVTCRAEDRGEDWKVPREVSLSVPFRAVTVVTGPVLTGVRIVDNVTGSPLTSVTGGQPYTVRALADMDDGTGNVTQTDITADCVWTLGGSTVSATFAVPTALTGTAGLACDATAARGTGYRAEVTLAVIAPVPAPEITGLAIDCSSTGGDCFADGLGNYTVSFNSTDATSYTVAVTNSLGSTNTGTIAPPPAGGSITGNTTEFEYTPGNRGGDVIRITITVTGPGGTASQFIDVELM